ncbi:MAG TPA: M3 family oligoendopeptidase [Tepidisphaeraceae bacterium]|nr:M3 family oligoendopeptidase [Tepidisphaeraceae bacterium]
MVATSTPRRFVPANLSMADFSQLQGLFDQLLQWEIRSPADLENLLLDYSEFYASIDDYGQRRYIDKSCHTDDAEIEKRFMHFVEEIEPQVKPLHFAMQRKVVQSPHCAALTDPKYDMLFKHWRADVELFRDANVPLETAENKLGADYDKTCGAMMVDFRGKEYTPSQMSRFGEEQDRETRQQAWEATVTRRMQDADKLEDLFDQMLDLRWRISKNCGLPDPRAYYFRLFKRFDYTPDDCARFAEGVAETFVPLMRRLDARRKRDLKISDNLRPWDLSVDPTGRPPLRPFSEDDIDSFVEKTHEIFRRVSPALADDFSVLRRGNLLDLGSRKGKAPGGFQSLLAEKREPFIFMNAVGTHGDVRVLLHEGGHAFHSLAARHEPLVFLMHAPIEFCEVASMAMELLSVPHYDVFYSSEGDIRRAKAEHLCKVVSTMPWVATIDSFQQWIYTHQGHSRAERTTAWLELSGRFGNEVDWSGWEAWNSRRWQAQLHLYRVPFYYIEYGIAQLGALQVWMKAKNDPHQALANYRAGLKLGGTRPLPQLFSAAGIHFDFSKKTMQPLADALEEELDSLGV